MFLLLLLLLLLFLCKFIFILYAKTLKSRKSLMLTKRIRWTEHLIYMHIIF